MSGSIVLVVPAYNEASRLDRAAFLAFIDSVPTARLLFVNDGSTDDTAAIVREMAAINSRVRLLSLEANQGKAEAVRQGVLLALTMDAEFIGYWDADLSTPLSAVNTLREELDCWPDTVMVMASRVRLLGRTIARRALRHYLGRVFATAVSLVLNVAVYDTQCGAKLFRASPEMGRCFDRPFASRWIFDVELLARLLDERPAPAEPETELIREGPLAEWRERGGSRLTAFDFVRAPLELMQIHRARSAASARRRSLPPA
jgi:dolichyl-phosphate beta-glucosyltransferase